MEIYKISKNNMKIISGCICFTVAIIWLAVTTKILITTYNKFNYMGYINNIFLLFNMNFMDNLMNYFADEGLVVELITILQFMNTFLTSCFLIIFLFCKAGLDFYLGGKYITIYIDGILKNEIFWYWKEFIGFKWSDILEYKFFKKGKYYKLILITNSKYDIKGELKLNVEYEDKEYVNNILSKYIEVVEEELKLNFMPFPMIPTKRLVLRKLKPEDKNEIFYLKSSEEILKYLDNKKHETIEESEKYIEKINNGVAQNQWIQWGITLNGSEKIIGTICLWNIEKDTKTAEVGYELMCEYQGKGIMQEALMTVMKYAFKFIKLKSLTAYTHKNNEKSINLLERNKFAYLNEDGNYKIYELNYRDVPLFR